MDEFEVPEQASTPPDLYPCDICGRNFVEVTLQKHIKICEKNAAKKRKVFDSSKQRTEGINLKNVPKADPKKLEKVKKQTANWRAKHEDLVSSLRNARGVTLAMKTGAPLPPPPSQTRVNPDYVKCPTCQRNFNETAADRHIPWCKEKGKRIATTSNRAVVDKGKMDVRTQYKPPLPGTKKRQIVQPRAGPALRTGKAGSGSSTQIESQYSNMSINDRTPPGRARTKQAGERGMVNGSKARSASLERRLEHPSNHRSSSGDSVRGKSSPNSRTPNPPLKHSSSSSLNRKPSLENIDGRRGSKFCHECGTQYPVYYAKFCCECGTRRAFLD